MSEPCLCGATDCKRCYPFSVYNEPDYDEDAFDFEKETEEQDDRRDHDREDKAWWAEVNK